MRMPWPKTRRERAAWGAVLSAAVLAAGSQWLEQWRPLPPDRSARFTFRVTTSADGGRGSLRDAILEADRLPARARILVVARQVVLETALPPLVNPFGTILEAPAGVDIDGTHIPGPVLDIASAGTLISRVHVIGGGAGIVVRAPGASLQTVSVTDSDVGVLVGEGSDALRISASVFDGNRIGVQLAAPSGGVSLSDVQFRNHRTAAVWAVTNGKAAIAPSIQIADSRFVRDAAGLIAINVTSRIERNRFDDEEGTAVHASGGRAFIGSNQIRSGKGFGIYAERLESGYITRNEIARQCSGGVLLRDASNTRVTSNQLYQNAYGVVVMEGPGVSPNYVADNLIADQIGDGLLLVGASPIVSRNQLLRNRQAGLRLSTLTTEGGKARAPSPLLEDNLVRGNGSDETTRDDYDSGTNDGPAAPSDCDWRRGAVSIATVRASREP